MSESAVSRPGKWEQPYKQKKRGMLGAFGFELAKNKFLYALALPGIIWFFIFAYLPMGGIVIAFQDFKAMKGITGSEFVGLRNFQFFFQSGDWVRIVTNTLFLNVLFIAFNTLAAVAIAIMLTELGGRWFKQLTQSVMIFPHFLSWTVVAMFVMAFVATDGGFLNQILSVFGIPPIQFLSSPEYWPLILVLLKIWHAAGFSSIVYIATIAGINPDIYESASIDGASRTQKIWHITLPLLKPTVILLLILAVGGIFNGDFGMIYAIIGRNPPLYPTTDVIDTYLFRAMMDLGDMSMSAAIGFLQSVVGFALVVTVNYIAKKVAPESAIF
ncbi:putative aldouronate transport system permease protein [Paenibacillus sp. UNCCL117]|uniref:ABC transporter permease n=1 Tax=unclassified Paenibacillus TaxID=185978 RepID=UPI00088D8E74|nr:MULTISPECIES: ABC transporter permease subunit [unclassified Paenibacillus]SDD06985.1 putative aldouronate transport system permease protein [Paenibacillus sp. cl123]SFW31579.1 putative aldouronate transport system permease protein [Paenibacillus sp. UNCCL117]